MNHMSPMMRTTIIGDTPNHPIADQHSANIKSLKFIYKRQVGRRHLPFAIIIESIIQNIPIIMIIVVGIISIVRIITGSIVGIIVGIKVGIIVGIIVIGGIIMMKTSVPIYALCESGPLDETPGTTVGPAYYKVVILHHHNDDRWNGYNVMAKMRIMTMLLMISRDIKTFLKSYRTFPHQASSNFQPISNLTGAMAPPVPLFP